MKRMTSILLALVMVLTAWVLPMPVVQAEQATQPEPSAKIVLLNADEEVDKGAKAYGDKLDIYQWQEGLNALYVFYNVTDKAIWESIISSTYKPQHEFEFFRPEGAVEAAMYVTNIAENPDAEAITYFEGESVEWMNVEQGNPVHTITVMDYELSESDGKTIITYKPQTHDQYVYLSWKDESGTSSIWAKTGTSPACSSSRTMNPALLLKNGARN